MEESSILSVSTASNAASPFADEDVFESEPRLTRHFLCMPCQDETSDVSGKYYCYILYSLKDKGLYIGYTENLILRLTSHAKGHVASTKFRRPIRLIHYEYFINGKDAKMREKFLKSGFGREQLNLILKNTNTNL